MYRNSAFTRGTQASKLQASTPLLLPLLSFSIAPFVLLHPLPLAPLVPLILPLALFEPCPLPLALLVTLLPVFALLPLANLPHLDPPFLVAPLPLILFLLTHFPHFPQPC